MTRQKTSTGRIGEDIACRELARAGYQVIERNWRCPEGEIDIIATQNGTWSFVEVKARHGRLNGFPEEAVTAAKIERIERAAERYLAEHQLDDVGWRIDAIAIELDHADQVAALRILKGLATDA